MIPAGGTGRAAGNDRLLGAETALGGSWGGQVVLMGWGGDVSKATITGRVEIWTQLKLTENVPSFKATLWIGVYPLRNFPFLICVLPGLQRCNLTISVTVVAFESLSAQCIYVCCNFLDIDDMITSILTLISSCPGNLPFLCTLVLVFCYNVLRNTPVLLDIEWEQCPYIFTEVEECYSVFPKKTSKYYASQCDSLFSTNFSTWLWSITMMFYLQ